MSYQPVMIIRKLSVMGRCRHAHDNQGSQLLFATLALPASRAWQMPDAAHRTHACTCLVYVAWRHTLGAVGKMNLTCGMAALNCWPTSCHP